MRAPAKDLLIGGAVTALAAAVRLHGLGARPFWIDEALEWYYASHIGLPAWLDLHLVELVPYLLHRVALLLGSSEAWFRIDACVFGILLVPLVYGTALRVYGRATATLAALLLAVSPLHVSLAQEARPYALFVFLAYLATWLFLRSMSTRRARTVAVFSWVLLLAFLTSSFTYLASAGIGLVFCLFIFFPSLLGGDPGGTLRRRLRPWAAALPAAAVLALVWGLEVRHYFTNLTAYDMPPTHTGETVFALMKGFLTYFSGAPVVAPLLTACALWGLVTGLRVQRRPTALFGAHFLLVPVYVTVLGWALGLGAQVKYVSYALPFFLLLVARGMTDLAGRMGRPAGPVLLAVAVLALLAASASGLRTLAGRTYNSPYVGDWRDLGARLKAQGARGGTWILEPASVKGCFEYYVRPVVGDRARAAYLISGNLMGMQKIFRIRKGPPVPERWIAMETPEPAKMREAFGWVAEEGGPVRILLPVLSPLFRTLDIPPWWQEASWKEENERRIGDLTDLISARHPVERIGQFLIVDVRASGPLDVYAAVSWIRAAHHARCAGKGAALDEDGIRDIHECLDAPARFCPDICACVALPPGMCPWTCRVPMMVLCFRDPDPLARARCLAGTEGCEALGACLEDPSRNLPR